MKKCVNLTNMYAVRNICLYLYLGHFWSSLPMSIMYCNFDKHDISF